MNVVNIRDREPADLQRCLSVLADVHRLGCYPLNWPDHPRRWLSPPNALHAWITEAGPASVVGHVAIHQDTSAASPATMTAVEVSRLFVAPAARRHGVASRLLDHVRQWATDRRLDLTLEVVDAPSSAAAVALFESTGWRHTHTATATWTTPDGGPVRLRRYTLGRKTP